MQFAFRWMNCLLMRELSMPCVVRMWDTYLVRPDLNWPIFTPLTDPRYPFRSDRGNGSVLPVPPLRLLSLPREVERRAAGDGLPGTSRSSFCLPTSADLAHLFDPSTGDHHVPPEPPNAGLDGRRGPHALE